MSTSQARPRNQLPVLLMVALALAGAAIGQAVVAAKDADGWTVPLVTMQDLLGNPGLYRGRLASMVLFEGQRPGDLVAPLVTRSDIHLHDETGSIPLLGGWQDWNRWRTGGCKPYSGESLDIDAGGTWTIHRATVNYTGDGLPYLTVSR
jgi:hypothetical protein